MVEKKKRKNKVAEEIENIRKTADMKESYLVGLMWSNPTESYATYGSHTKGDDFLHKIWGFYFELGKLLYKQGLQTFDDISVNSMVAEKNLKDMFEEYGGLSTIRDLVNIVKENSMNIEAYYDAMLKNKVIMSLMEVLGDQVIVDKGNYKYKNMNARQIATYWQNKMNNIAVDSVSNFESENLYVDSEDFLDSLEDKSDGFMRFYHSNLLNDACRGMPRGEVTILGGFGNSGKSSFMTDKILMSCLTSDEKTLVVLNEEPAEKLREKLLLSIINHELGTYGTDEQKSVNRWKFTQPDKLDDEDRELIEKAFNRWNELLDGNDEKIKIVFMEQYQIEDLKNIIALHANQGYVNLIIDTHKVPDNYKTASRWEAIVEATKEIYKLSRKESGGFNLRTILTVQLADVHIKDKFLGYDAIGEGKAMKNEASIFMMYRPLFTKEYETLKVHKKVRSNLTGNSKKKYIYKEQKLDPEKTYYVMFMPKNRYGNNTDNGMDCIVYEARFEYNSFVEIGTTRIARSYD